MQALYTLDSISNEPGPGEALKLLNRQMAQTRQLFVYLTYFLTEVARYAEKDSLKKSNKHLPSAEDLNINTKIVGNELLWKILETPSFIGAVGELKPVHIIDEQLLKSTYQTLICIRRIHRLHCH
jgi:transcription antitermination protein NusB